MITITIRITLAITDLEQRLTQTSRNHKEPSHLFLSCSHNSALQSLCLMWHFCYACIYVKSQGSYQTMEKINNNGISLSTASVPLALGSVRISDIMCMRLLSMTCRRCWSMTIRVASCTGLNNWTLMWTTQLDMRGLSFVLTSAVEIYGQCFTNDRVNCSWFKK